MCNRRKYPLYNRSIDRGRRMLDCIDANHREAFGVIEHAVGDSQAIKMLTACQNNINIISISYYHSIILISCKHHIDIIVELCDSARTVR